jgi:phosphoglycerate dehydrogenase-like enzyme
MKGGEMLRVAVIDDYMRRVEASADWSAVKAFSQVEFFHDHLTSEDDIAARLAHYDIVVAERERTAFPASLLARLPKLKLLVATGTDNWVIDFEAASRQGVIVTFTGAVMSAMPELAWGLILSLSRRIAWDHAVIQNGGWQTGPGKALHGGTFGVLGLGVAGTQMVQIARAFGMRCIAWSQNLTAEQAKLAGAHRVELDELLATADVVSIQLVLSDRTRGLLGARELALMKPTALLVNTSRGPIVQEKALIDALESKRIWGAGLDVYEVEPLPASHPFRKLENVVLTPHTGYVTERQLEVFYTQAVENIVAFVNGTPIRVAKEGYSASKKKAMAV